MRPWMPATLLIAAATCPALAGPEVGSFRKLNPSPPGRATLTLNTGYRRDDFEWNIAGDNEGRNPNVLSDLDWADLNIIPIGGRMDLTWQDRWHLRLDGQYGWIVSGRNRDSDYDNNNRRRESSRSEARTDGDVADAEALFGYDFPLPGKRITLTPWGGYAFHRQSLNDHSGVQEVDREGGPLGAFPGLDSLYAARWRGVVLGGEAAVRLAETWQVRAGLSYQWLEYSAHADWNLRADLAGFTHRADGGMWRFQASLEWEVRPQWALGLAAYFNKASTGHGKDVTNSSDGFQATTRLNGVSWTSLGVDATVTRRF